MKIAFYIQERGAFKEVFRSHTDSLVQALKYANRAISYYHSELGHDVYYRINDGPETRLI